MQEKEMVTPGLIKELRERTGVGMAKCKEALEHAKGNIEEAIAYLRKAGIASAVKKHGRETKEGAIVFKENNGALALCEINAETDFVVKNDKFAQFCNQIVDEILNTKPSTVEHFMQQKHSKNPQETMDELRCLLVQLIGENIQVSRLMVLDKKPGRTIAVYSHMGGKIVTAVELEGADELDLAKDIALHIAAAAPEYLDPQAVPAEIQEKEKEYAKLQIQGKPDFIVDKIVEGKLNAFFEMHCLVRQKFIKDDKCTIQDLVNKRAQETGKKLSVVRFIRWVVGQ